jgi:hypothetical protein
MASQAFSHALATAIGCSGQSKTNAESERIRRMSSANAFWGAPSLVKLLKLRLDVSQATVGGYLPRRSKTVPDWVQLSANRPTDPSTCSLS